MTPHALALEDWEQIDKISDQFEANWPVEIESHLALLEPRLRPHLLRELLAIELERRTSSGRDCVQDDYLNRFPDFSEVVAAVFLASQSVSLTHTLDLPGGSPRPAQPTQLGRYEILKVLGQGGYGVVYLARDPALAREVAIKAPLPGALKHAGLESYLAEAQTVARLEIPGIVPVYDVGRAEGSCFLVSKYVPGGNLQVLADREMLPAAKVVALTAKIARILHAAHKKGFFHCDIKPANILLDEEGAPHITDFGLSLHESQQQTHAGRVAGTALFMSPEQVRGDIHLADGRVDVWALGVMLYQLLTGRYPFDGTSRDEAFERISRQDPKPPRMINDAVPPELERITLKCLAKSPQQRYLTALDLAEDLERWLAGDAKPDGQRGEYRPGARGPGWAIWGTGAGVAAGVLATCLTAWLVASSYGVGRPPAPPQSIDVRVSVWSGGSRFVDVVDVAPARSGTEIRVAAEIPPGLQGQIFSINPDGTVMLLAELSAQASDRMLYFPGAEQASPLQGPIGTEWILVCASRTPLSAMQLQELLQPALPLPALRQETVIRLTPGEVGFEQKGRDFGPARQTADPDEDAAGRLRTAAKALAARCAGFGGLAFLHTDAE